MEIEDYSKQPIYIHKNSKLLFILAMKKILSPNKIHMEFNLHVNLFIKHFSRFVVRVP